MAKKDQCPQLGIIANIISKVQTGLIESLTEVSEPGEKQNTTGTTRTNTAEAMSTLIFDKKNKAFRS